MSTWSPNDSQTQPIETVSSTETGVESGVIDNEVASDIDSIGPNRLFEVLKNQRRRHVLRYLLKHDGSVTIGTLAEHIAVLENDTTLTALTSRERKRVYIGLYQSHLPKMDDAGAVEFNKARGVIALGPNTAQFQPYLDLRSKESDSWSRYYLLLAGIGGLLFILQSIAEPSVGLSLAQLLVGILCGFILLSIVHLSRVSDRIASP
jgi:hypothetical protein